MSIWQGAFAPLRKHRDYCGNIENHIEIRSVELLDADEATSPDGEEPEDDETVERTVIGDGSMTFLVMMGWVGGGLTGTEYEYEVNVDREPTDNEARHMIAEYIQEENARRRKAKEEEIAHE